jgi:hypothetical protein
MCRVEGRSPSILQPTSCLGSWVCSWAPSPEAQGIQIEKQDQSKTRTVKSSWMFPFPAEKQCSVRFGNPSADWALLLYIPWIKLRIIPYPSVDSLEFAFKSNFPCKSCKINTQSMCRGAGRWKESWRDWNDCETLILMQTTGSNLALPSSLHKIKTLILLWSWSQVMICSFRPPKLPLHSTANSLYWCCSMLLFLWPWNLHANRFHSLCIPKATSKLWFHSLCNKHQGK